jgi:hypothetical protein
MAGPLKEAEVCLRFSLRLWENQGLEMPASR